ncbi:MAG TPA: D-aminoacylase [Candidatus Sulfotelmatobacter sp.]|nr:D-aminoacylase [Candidatus Sulfotelmatobacter sp.]
MRFDLLIRSGRLFDGSGAPGGAIGDVAVKDGRIVGVGGTLAGDAATEIDAHGLVVAPGFIDIKTHSDFVLPINPTADSKVRQGVTTEIVGHCGFSIAPVLPGRVELLKDYLSGSAPWLPFREVSFPDYLDGYPATSVNVGMLVGHNTLRLMVMGMEQRAPSASELAHMIALLEDGLDAGALGLSSGLFTAPGSYAERAEMVALCEVVRRHDAAYFTHLRDESRHVMAALDEAIDIAETCGVHVQVVHLKCSGTDNWGKAGQILERLAAARARGLAIDCDAYPYTAGSNPLKNLLPQWVQAGGVPAMVARLRTGEARDRIRADIARDGLNNWGRLPSWDAVRISISPHLPELAGWTIGRLAAEKGIDPVDALCDHLAADQGATRVLVTTISEDDVRTIVRSQDALVGSDGNCVCATGVTSGGLPHPRFYGTYPRVLGHYVEELGLLPLERAIYKMTGGPARALGLRDRGLLKEGWRADLALFDPTDFKERATYDQPHQYPSGARTTVIVNGTVVVRDATHTGATPGVVLRRAADVGAPRRAS